VVKEEQIINYQFILILILGAGKITLFKEI